MPDPRIEKMADVLVNYSTAVQPGDKVLLMGDELAAPLLRAVYAKVLQAGGHPQLLVQLSGTQELFYRYANDDQLAHIPEPVKLMLETYDVRIRIGAAANTRELSGVDPAQQVKHGRAMGELLRIQMRRGASGALRWCSTLYPTQAYAQDAGMSLSDYEDFVFGACMPEMDDPIGYWRRFSAWQQKIVDWLAGKSEVHVTAPGTDLRLNVAGRTFINSDGTHNMPSGEVFTGPVEDSAEGQILFSYPAIFRGQEVSGIRLWFEGGKVVKASAESNEELLLRALDTDEGSRFLGEFAIGTNAGITQFTKQILFDEKINGSIHLALGAGYPDTGSVNQSAIHWDMVCDMRDGGEIRVDGELLYKDGAFAIEL
jgi:aminopeptidase